MNGDMNIAGMQVGLLTGASMWVGRHRPAYWLWALWLASTVVFTAWWLLLGGNRDAPNWLLSVISAVYSGGTMLFARPALRHFGVIVGSVLTFCAGMFSVWLSALIGMLVWAGAGML